MASVLFSVIERLTNDVARIYHDVRIGTDDFWDSMKDKGELLWQFAGILRHAFDDLGPIAEAIVIILEQTTYQVTPKDLNMFNLSAGLQGAESIGSRFATRTLVRSELVAGLAEHLMPEFGARVLGLAAPGLDIILIEDLFDQASRARDRLKSKYPILYRKMRMKGVEMVFFLVEPTMEKYLNAIYYSRICHRGKSEESLVTCSE